ncbi:hypothetical protein GGC64_004523 [Mycobacterium sp. OAS707]|uniref:hypothetical protein n=1 Tax=Mycobacterium sp. OAS707 TaxID=2663822 RepID=UPI001789DB71|nr:hypothetical protein [Mycobacterium sp. OAS707]MBE1550483.1 hypothetical protein [Mycobacterium sp. OAS707]
MGSRVHGAASACFVAVGLFLCGLGGALAIAEPSSPSDLPPGTHSNDVHDNGPKSDSDGKDGSKASAEEDPQSAEDKPGNGENPGNGNCGNDGSNGNAQHCGGGSESPPPSPSTTKSTESSTKTTESSTKTTESSTKTTTTKTTTSSETTGTTSTTSSSVGVPAPGIGGGGGGGAEAPSGRPQVPAMQLPPASEPSAIDVVPGVGAAAVEVPIPPMTLPIIVAPAAGLGAGSAGLPELPAAPRAVSAEPPAGREPLPANVGSNVAVPAASYRVGYADYLRNAGLSQVAALAVPGVTGMLVLTGAGGWVGYRQAKAGHAVHTNGTARFVN